jgi:hypothetical protein
VKLQWVWRSDLPMQHGSQATADLPARDGRPAIY